MTTVLTLTPDVVDITMEVSDYRGLGITFVDQDDLPLDLTGYVVTVEGPDWMTSTVQDPPTDGIVLVALRPTGRDAREWRMLATGATQRVLCTGKVKVT